MTKSDVEQYRRQLLDLSHRLKGDISSLAKEALRSTAGDQSGGLSKLPLHLADLGSDSYDHELAISFLENDNQIAEEIKLALERIDGGTFGRCEECKQSISKERLQAVPFTRYCIDCARQLEERGEIGRNTTLP
jgi:RNA polymerase-binding transcription factor DksA